MADHGAIGIYRTLAYGIPLGLTSPLAPLKRSGTFSHSLGLTSLLLPLRRGSTFSHSLGLTPPLAPVRHSDAFVRSLPTWTYTTNAALIQTPANGALSGVVKESAVPVAYALVRLYWRPSGDLIAQTKTGVNGAFSFVNLDPTTNNYYVVALDPDSGVQYNAIIFDRLTPV